MGERWSPVCSAELDKVRCRLQGNFQRPEETSVEQDSASNFHSKRSISGCLVLGVLDEAWEA